MHLIRTNFQMLLISLLVASCATFEPSMQFRNIMIGRQPTVRDSQGGLEVSVEEFVSPEKSGQAFDADIASYGVLALLLSVENKGSEIYHVHQSDVQALLGGRSLVFLSGVDAANRAATSETIGKALAWTVATGPFFILTWPFTVGGSTYHTQTTNRRIQQHFEDLRFTGASLKPNQQAAGFVYFLLPEGVSQLENLSLSVRASEEQTGRRLSYNLALPPLRLPSSKQVDLEKKG